MKLRDYELDWLRRIRGASARRVLVVGPTGSGKTVVAAALMRGAMKRGRVLFVVHRRELVKQAVQRLRESGVARSDIGVMLGGARVGEETVSLASRREAPIQVASIQTLRRTAKWPKASCVLIDEAHHAAAPTYRALIAHYPDAHVYGLTATPYRLDGRALGDLFDEIVSSPQPSELIAARWLMKPRVYTVPADQRPDLSGVRVLYGDFAKKDLARVVNRKVLIGNIVDHYIKYAGGRTAVCYAVNVEHGQQIKASFVERGIRAELLTGTVKIASRVAMLARLASGITRVLVNCMVLTEGWDCPEVKLAIVARPTLSTCLWMQMCGRITRPTAGEATPIPIVLDHAGNAHVHGLPLENAEYALDGRRVMPSAKPGTGPEKLCPECGCALPTGARVCTYCGHEFSVDEIAEVKGKLVLAARLAIKNRCKWEHCPTPDKPVTNRGAARVGQGPVFQMHAHCRAEAGLRERRCMYAECLTPNIPVSYNGWRYGTRMHRECRDAALGRMAQKRNRCQWEHCLTPDKPVMQPGHGKPGLMHAACIRARSEAARRCQYEHCPTPEKLLNPKARTRGNTMHLACAAKSHAKSHADRVAACMDCGCDLKWRTGLSRAANLSRRCRGCAMRRAWQRQDYQAKMHERSACTRKRCAHCGEPLAPHRHGRYHPECWHTVAKAKRDATHTSRNSHT